MAEIINLNRFRKTRERQEARQRAEENRARFGQKKTEREKMRDDAHKAEKDLDSKRLD